MTNINIGNDVVLELKEVTEVIQCFLNGRDDAYAYSKAALATFQQDRIMFERLKNEHPELTGTKEFDQTQALINNVLPDCGVAAEILANNPILIIDSVIDNLVNNTSPAIEKFKMPYDGFFINKKFEIEGGFVAGVFVYDPLEITLQACKRTGQYTLRRKLMQERENHLKERLKDPATINDDICIMCIVFRNGGLTMTYATVNDILNPQTYNAKYANQLEYLSPAYKPTAETVASETKLMIEIEKTVFNYAVNIANLMNLHSDPANPRNPKRDLQIMPTNLKNAQGVKVKKIKNVYKIHVGGKIRKYAEGYNEAVRRNGCLHAVHVRGHYRTFHSERYTKMYGKTIWIPPFVRGADKELRQRIIEIIE